MNLDQIKEQKTKEAEDFFLKIGLDPLQETPPFMNDYLLTITDTKEETGKKPKLQWTRLSINSNIGNVVE